MQKVLKAGNTENPHSWQFTNDIGRWRNGAIKTVLEHVTFLFEKFSLPNGSIEFTFHPKIESFMVSIHRIHRDKNASLAKSIEF